jgi:hypothetical protein
MSATQIGHMVENGDTRHPNSIEIRSNATSEIVNISTRGIHVVNGQRWMRFEHHP